RLVATLATVSPVVEPAELGRAYIGTDGLEGLFGAPEKIVEVIQLRIADCGLRIGNGSAESAIANPQSEIRVGWGRGECVSWVAVGGRVWPEPIVAALTFYSPVGERELLARTLDTLLDRALKNPRRIGWRVHVVCVRAELEHGASWRATATLKDPTADRERLAAPLRSQLEQSPPAGAVERLAVEFTAFAPGTAALQLFARAA